MIFFKILIFLNLTFGESCSLDTITNNCALLRNLSPTSAMLFPDGHLMPGCAFASVSVNDKMDSIIAADTKIQDILNSAQPRFSMSELESMMELRTLAEAAILPDTTQLWPPVGSSQDRIVVSREMMENFWIPKLGKTGFKNLKSAVFERMQAEKEPDSPVFEFSMKGQRERATLLFNESKRLVISSILNGRPKAALSPPEKEVLARVEQTSLNLGLLSSDVAPCTGQTASFDHDVAEVNLPPDMMLLPNQSILRALVHEISHAFDMCILSTVGGRNNGSIIRENVVINHTGFRIVSPKDHPYSEVFNCLKSTRGGNFNGPPSGNGEACSDGKTNEAFCDWNASQILGSNPDSLNLRTTYGSPRPIGSTYSDVVHAPPGFDVITGLSDYACKDTQNRNIEHPSANHPHGRERVNNILLREPGIRQRFGNCSGTYSPPCRRTPADQESGNTEAVESMR